MATTKDKNAVVLKAVQQLKDSDFKVTGIKVELEANLNRRSNRNSQPRTRNSSGRCLMCNEGTTICEYCPECDTCGSDGDMYSDEEDQYINCTDCDGTGVDREMCDYLSDHLEGTRTIQCQHCEGNYQLSPEELIAAGEIQRDFGREVDCHNFLLEQLAPLGLATKLTAEERIAQRGTLQYGVDTEYAVKHPLVFGNFYNDGSVDSEFTYTIALDDKENIMLLPKVTEAWNKLVAAIGNGCDVKGAGMHMALIREPNCKYPDRNHYNGDSEHYHNFEKSMRLLIPALFFLGSVNNVSRALRFREPRVSGEKYSAISFHNGVLEYRVFETCYDNPAAILDNVVVMANTMKYWTSSFNSTGIEKKVKQLNFGTDDNNSLHRFYNTPNHIDVLNMGLDKLKPAYYTITELKQQRDFDINKRSLGKLTKQRRKQAEREYQEYENRFNWRLEVLKVREMYNMLSETQANTTEEADRLRSVAESRATERVASETKAKKSLDKYLDEVMANFHKQGRWSLEVN